MYIYHALINALNTHMICINLNMTLYTYVEHSPTKKMYIKYYMEKQTYTHTQTAVNSNVYDTDLCHTSHTHTQWQAETGYWYWNW